jgi:two-component system, response regulator PdtaR
MPAQLPWKSTTVVLIVEDDALLRMLAVEIVEEAGFVAIEAADADEAVSLLESRSDIVLLLTDIDMPGSMNGLTLAHAVRNRWPSIKILVVSGKCGHSPPSFRRTAASSQSHSRQPRWLRDCMHWPPSQVTPIGNLAVSTELFCSDVSAKFVQIPLLISLRVLSRK